MSQACQSMGVFDTWWLILKRLREFSAKIVFENMTETEQYL